jgi:uncharacterized protein DUF4192
MTSDRVTLRTPTDLLAAVPYLLGFHPTDSVVAVALRGARVVFNARADLPAPAAAAGEVEDLAGQLTDVLVAQRAGAAFVLGYGAAARVTRAVMPVAARLGARGVTVLDVLRVTSDRYWSYLCTSPACCPAEGTPYEPRSTEVAAAATYAGRLVLPDRAALVASVAAPAGARLAAIEAATEAQAARLATLASPAARHRAGVEAVHAALRAQRRGARIEDAALARLSLLLPADPVRAVAWRDVARAGADVERRVDLWQAVTRRARPDLAATPAALLAFAAWRAGAGALAWVAVERALTHEPTDPRARFIAEVLARALPPALPGAPLGPTLRERGRCGGRQAGAR